MGRFTLILGLAGSALLLSACSESQKQTLGFSQPPPDEFRVITRAPLTVPPNLALRPPIPGAVRPQEGTPSEQARQAVFRAGETGKQASPSRSALAQGMWPRFPGMPGATASRMGDTPRATMTASAD